MNLLTYLKDRAKNLLNDVTELEGALATVTTLSGTLTAVAAGNSQAQRIVGAVLGGVGVASIVLKKVADALRGVS